MVSPLINLVNNPGFQNLAQNTYGQVAIETGLKAIGRPAFTLKDKCIDKETRKYSASRELIYQLLCLGLYLAAIIPLKKLGYNKIAKMLSKHDSAFTKMPNYKVYDEAVTALGGEKNMMKQYPIAKGAVEFASIIGSAIMLTMIAPGVVNMVVHPIMNALGIKKKDKAKEGCGCAAESQNNKGLNTIK